ncbi:hypothetical protein [Amycolatopsis taiwanensis]|uniref:hypothetical protein n=1 Tax=Amycolatopsis taiwanensis TaxID=342230 RepID=UPI000484E06A|nr:hypothetical protein [Amycolatopsis taiwanensis]
MKFLLTFLPWIVFAVAGTQLDWRYAGLIGLGLATILFVVERIKRNPLDSLVIEMSSIIYFAAITIFAFADPSSPLRTILVGLASAWLALTAWGSLAVGAPFTLGIAKRVVEREAWDHPLFRRTNVVITTVWATSFTVEAIALTMLLAFAPHASVATVIIKIAAFAVPVTFTMRYSALAEVRAQRLAAQGLL